MDRPLLLSVNIGKPEQIEAKTGLSGIFKRPVEGSVHIDHLGLEGDAVMDKKHHGGPDQAVYIYLQWDYDWWGGELGETPAPGTFGENLTIAGVAGETLSVGDRFAIGDVLLEVTVYRNPCSTFAKRMGDAAWARRFHRALRPGPYARVLQPGAVRQGDAVDYRRFAGEPVYLNDLMALHYQRDIDAATLKRVLAAPVHHKMRDDFEARLRLLER